MLDNNTSKNTIASKANNIFSGITKQQQETAHTTRRMPHQFTPKTVHTLLLFLTLCAAVCLAILPTTTTTTTTDDTTATNTQNTIITKNNMHTIVSPAVPQSYKSKSDDEQNQNYAGDCPNNLKNNNQNNNNNNPSQSPFNFNSILLEELPPIETIHADFTKWTQRPDIQIQGSQHIYITHFEQQQYEYNINDNLNIKNHEMVSVRGVAVKHDVLAGQVLISVPFHALISADSIERDAVLQPILGRGSSMWYNAHRYAAAATDGIEELLPLSIYLLYHVSLGVKSPIVEYINILLTATPLDDMPLLWSEERLMREYPDENHGVRVATEEILDNMRGMYEAIVPGLVEDHPHLFARPASDSDADADWMYSFDRFRWAFAMLNSRHWHLPCDRLDYNYDDYTDEQHQDLDNDADDDDQDSGNLLLNNNEVEAAVAGRVQEVGTRVNDDDDDGNDVQNILQAKSQTMILHNDGSSGYDLLLDGDIVMENGDDDYMNANNVHTHAFLAPFADLVNFGPPCAKGSYNKDTASFEIIATCDLMAGQEVTFWYTDDCEDIVLANYGFTHPLVKRCLTGKEWQERSIMWQEAAEDLERQLVVAWDEVERLQRLLIAYGDEGVVEDDDLPIEEVEGKQQKPQQPSRERRVRGNHGGIRKKTGQYDDGSL